MERISGKVSGWNWESFYDDLKPYLERFSKDWKGLLDVLTECEAFWRKIVEREAGIESDRPQDFVAAILATQSFRVALSNLILQMSGYTDEATGLERTLDDIWLRLSVISREPVKASLGYYYSYVLLEIDVVKQLMEQAGGDESPLVESLRQSLDRLINYRVKVRNLIKRQGFKPAELNEEYGKIRMGEAARSIHPEVGKTHKLRSMAQGAYIHARGFGIDRFILKYSPKRVFSVGPIYDTINIMRIHDTIKRLLANLQLAAALTGLEGVDDEAAGTLGRLEKALYGILHGKKL